MYTVVVEKPAQKKLYKLPTQVYDRIIDKLKGLAVDPRPSGSKKLTNKPGYRIRIGDYRVIYEIEDKVLIVLVLDVDHRKQIYD